MSIKFKPLADRVLIETVATEEKTTSGIFIPDTAKEKPSKGIVIAVGNEPMTVKVGDIVIYDKYSGDEIKLEYKKYLIMKESDIYGIL